MMRRFLASLASVLAAAAVVPVSLGAEGFGPGFELWIEGVISYVRDGDTINLAWMEVRIANLDCAEMNTKAARLAHERMAGLVQGRRSIRRAEEAGAA